MARFSTRFRSDFPEPYLDPDKSIAIHAYLRQKDPKIESDIALENEVRPGILTGWLHIDCDSDATASNGEEQISRWRLGLEVCSPWCSFSRMIALSGWQTTEMPGPFDEKPPNIELKTGVRILGEVFGWIGAQSATATGALKPTKSQK